MYDIVTTDRNLQRNLLKYTVTKNNVCVQSYYLSHNHLIVFFSSKIGSLKGFFSSLVGLSQIMK